MYKSSYCSLVKQNIFKSNNLFVNPDLYLCCFKRTQAKYFQQIYLWGIWFYLCVPKLVPCHHILALVYAFISNNYLYYAAAALYSAGGRADGRTSGWVGGRTIVFPQTHFSSIKDYNLLFVVYLRIYTKTSIYTWNWILLHSSNEYVWKTCVKIFKEKGILKESNKENPFNCIRAVNGYENNIYMYLYMYVCVEQFVGNSIFKIDIQFPRNPSGGGGGGDGAKFNFVSGRLKITALTFYLFILSANAFRNGVDRQACVIFVFLIVGCVLCVFFIHPSRVFRNYSKHTHTNTK